MKIDLHSHSNCSDGALTPRQLVERARDAGLDLLAITDHDTVAAWRQLDEPDCGSLQLISGIEYSSQWQKIGIHIVGLNIDVHSDATTAGVSHQQRAREQRATLIAERLAKLGVGDCLEGARNLAKNASIGRLHFARHLVAIGAAKDLPQAFKKYLGAGKAGDIRHLWAEPEQVIRWIREAGGTAVLAHPGKYQLTRNKLKALVADFAAAGGQALEVVCGQQLAEASRHLADLAGQYQLLSSCGSDFHVPGQSWSELGRCPVLPPGCRPVWNHW